MTQTGLWRVILQSTPEVPRHMIVFEHPTRTTNLDQLKSTAIGRELDADALTDWKLCTWIRHSKTSAQYWLRSGRLVCEVTINGETSQHSFSSIRKG